MVLGCIVMKKLTWGDTQKIFFCLIYVYVEKICVLFIKWYKKKHLFFPKYLGCKSFEKKEQRCMQAKINEEKENCISKLNGLDTFLVDSDGKRKSSGT